jgi:hypothetical protein
MGIKEKLCILYLLRFKSEFIEIIAYSFSLEILARKKCFNMHRVLSCEGPKI